MAHPDDAVDSIVAEIRSGRDPLGEAFYRLRSAARRRDEGAIFTPRSIVHIMLSWPICR